MAVGKKNISYIIGLVIVVISWAASFYMHFLIITIPVFILGLVLIWVSQVRTKTKVITTLIPIILWYPVVATFVLANKKEMSPETFLIPSNFRGQITVYYEEPCGEEVTISQGRRIYRIPSNGVLILKNKFETGLVNQKYFFVTNDGKQTEIDKLYREEFNEEDSYQKNPKEPSRSEVGVFLLGSSASANLHLHSLHINCYDSLRVFNEQKYEQYADSILQDCRTKKSITAP
jgi:hypothetical protein